MEVVQDEHAPNTMCHHTYFETDGFFEEGSSSEKSSKIVNNHSSSSSLSSPGSTNNNFEGLGLGFHAKKYGSSVEETDHSSNSSNSSFISFKTPAAAAAAAGSLLSFDQRILFSQEDSFSRMMINISSSRHGDHDDDGNDYSIWEENNNNNSHYNYQSQIQQMLQQNSNNINSTASASASSEVNLGWLSSDEPNNSIQVLGRPESCSFNKRPYMGESTQALKKQCTAGVTKMPKSNKSKDPQSIAAKNRRERISERLKILQDLVPNGSKVDLVTMLEKAISYVKFLQLQVKVLATDEFWPAQGGKAPDLSQVREAIDAILASQRDRNSTSKY